MKIHTVIPSGHTDSVEVILSSGDSISLTQDEALELMATLAKAIATLRKANAGS